MRIKKKNILLIALFAVLVMVCAALIIPSNHNSVYAISTKTGELTTKGVTVDSLGNVEGVGSPEEYYTLTMYGSSVNGTGTLNNYSVIDWTYVNIKFNAINNIRQLSSFILKKDGVDVYSKSLSGTATQILYQGALSDGDYEIDFRVSYNINKSSFKSSNYKFNFSVDITAPMFELKAGDGIIENGGNTSKRITYSANDAHFQRLYYKSPSASTYSTTTNNSFTVEPTISNSGWWYFYAIDTLGQKNETVSVYLDCKPPVLTCANGMKFGTTVGDSIKVTAADEVSSVKLYVKFEQEEWFSSGSTYTIPNTERNGRYYFYAEDGNGNCSDTVWIVLSTEEPTGRLIKSDTDNSISFVWNNEYWSATLDGRSYTEGNLISNEGQHEIILSNNANKSKKYNFRIDHYYKVTEQTAATCSENGMIKYECSQCGDCYEEILYSSGHHYEVTTYPSTCTEAGQKVYTCSSCGARYEEEGEYPTGHSYVSTIIVKPTCTMDGERYIKCEKCGDSYSEIMPASGHNYEIRDNSVTDGKTTRIYICTECGDSYTQELGNQYDQVATYVEYLFEQYEPYMWWVLLATAGVWSIAIGVAIILAHRNEDKEKAKKMLVNYVVGLVVIAAIVVACPYLIRGIAILVTS